MYTASQLLEQLNIYISEFSFIRNPETLYEPIKYVLSNGGKRIRPVLMLMAYNLYRENIEAAYAPAAAIEIYHNCTLLHDDLMDKADMRRGKKTVHKAWNNNIAILSGDAMLVLAYRYLEKCPPEYLNEILELFNETVLGVCEGQQYDMDFEQRDNVAETEYLEMIRLKTAILFAAGLKIGGILGGASGEDADHLYNFGIRLGIAFQLKDDYLDVYGDSLVFGKNLGGDILSNKKTYLLIKAIECANGFQTGELKKWLKAANYDPQGKITAVIDIYNQLEIKKICENKIQEYYTRALEDLKAVTVDPAKRIELRSLVQHLMCREL